MNSPIAPNRSLLTTGVSKVDPPAKSLRRYVSAGIKPTIFLARLLFRLPEVLWHMFYPFDEESMGVHGCNDESMDIYIYM